MNEQETTKIKSEKETKWFWCAEFCNNYGLSPFDHIAWNTAEGAYEAEHAPEHEKTYPIGYDPDGEWGLNLCSSNPRDGVLKLQTAKLDSDHRPYYLANGLSFTTEEQAKKAAAGKNAMRELVIMQFEADEYQYVTKISVRSSILSSVIKCTIADIVVEKLGEEKIKLALEWGM